VSAVRPANRPGNGARQLWVFALALAFILIGLGGVLGFELRSL
jgi:hypothetical protein